MPDVINRKKRKRRSRILRSVVVLRGSSRAVAGGLAIGVFVAFTPTLGFQTIFAAFLATLWGANRPASMLTVWITNPATTAPTFLFTYNVGRILWAGSGPEGVQGRLMGAVQRIHEHGALEIGSHFQEFLRLGVDIFVPLLIGGALVGLIAAIPVYFVSLWLIELHRQRRARRKRQRRYASSAACDAFGDSA